MNTSADKQTLSGKWARRCISSLVENLAQQNVATGSFPIYSAEKALDAATLLGFTEQSKKLEKLLSGKTVGDKLKHTITNIIVPKEKLDQSLGTSEKIDKLSDRYPIFDGDYISNEITQNDRPSFLECLNGNFDRAISMASDEWEISCIAGIMLVMGEFESAIELFPNKPDPFELVLAIELFRRDRIVEAQPVLEKILLNNDWWAHSDLALGIAGRVPWQVYPFNDY